MSESVGILCQGNFQRVLMLTPLMARIRAQYPYANIILVCDQSIKEHREQLPNVDSFLSVDKAVNMTFDTFINVDLNESSCLLSSKIHTRSIKGFVYDEYGNKKTNVLWFKYLEHMDDPNFLNMLHFSDVISAASGVVVKELSGIGFNSEVKNDMDTFTYGPYGPNISVTIDGNNWLSCFDRDGFLEYLPAQPIDINKKMFYAFIYRSVWKSTISRNILVGDPQRFMSFGETFLDRMVDIDREVDRLVSRTFQRFHKSPVLDLIFSQESFIKRVVNIKELAFNGQRAAKELLSATARNIHDINEIRDIKMVIQDVESKIVQVYSQEKYLMPLIELFNAEDPTNEVKNLFPLAKSIMLSFEDLFSRASFLEEILKGLDKKSRGVAYE